MVNVIYTPEQLNTIQVSMIGLIDYVKDKVTGKLPRCFDYCEVIVHNISICRQYDYDGIEELTAMIKHDWKNAMEIHTGLPEFYITNDNEKLRMIQNEKLSGMILDVDYAIAVND